MKIHKLIFSDKPVYRIQRHLLFWTVRFFLIFLFSYGVSFLNFLTTGEGNFLEGIEECYQVGSMRLVIDIVYCYAIVFWLLPGFLFKKKYTAFVMLLAILTLLSFSANSIFVVHFYDLMEGQREKLFTTIWLQVIHFILGGSPVVCVAFLAIRMLKIWYIKEAEKVAITRENANAELQLLKAQIHPHFLFNTLNNIYSFTLAGHPKAAALADRLSGMMDYMGTEGEKEFVPVEKEIQLIQDYMSLEKVRYDDRLDMQIEINGDYKNKIIAPLLMIPFAENCFKHGASVMRGNIWVRLNITVENNLLRLDLSNSKPVLSPAEHSKKGIGLINVKKRLQLIYPGEHILRIESTDTVYSVYLEVKLHEQSTSAVSHNPIHPYQSLSYA
ncbi:MAG TPA: histidine kinase [Chitinophagaceae bacterium]|nr:histidine kinase [Chitinophagaceae bacterium]